MLKQCWGVAVLLLFVGMSSVFSASYYRLQLNPVQWDSGESRNYDPFSLTRFVQTVPAQIFFDKASTAEVFVTFSKGGSDEYNRNAALGTLTGRDIDTFKMQSAGYNRKAKSGNFSLNYQLYGSFDCVVPLKDVPEAQNAQDVLSYAFLGNETPPLNFSYYLVVEPGQVVPPGTYTDIFTVTLHQGNMSAPYSSVLLDQVQVKLTIVVKESMKYVLKGIKTKNNELMPLDFGKLETGKLKELDVDVYSNVPYILQFSSKNQGQFKHKSASVKTSLPYWLSLNNKAIPYLKDTLTTLVSTSELSNKLGHTYHFEFKLGEASHLLSGEYLDQVSWYLKTL